MPHMYEDRQILYTLCLQIPLTAFRRYSKYQEYPCALSNKQGQSSYAEYLDMLEVVPLWGSISPLENHPHMQVPFL